MAQPKVEKSFGEKMKEEVERTMSDMNDILERPVRDEDWGVIHAIANHAKKPNEEVAKLIRDMPVGTVFSEDLVTRTVFAKTPDNKLEPVQRYVTRLEKLLLKYAQNEVAYKAEISKLKTQYQALYETGFLGQLSVFFGSFLEKIKQGLRWIGILE